MSGAPVTFTLYRNGIHVSPGPEVLVVDRALRALLARAFDDGVDPNTLTFGGPLDPLFDHVAVAIDSTSFVDRRSVDWTAPTPPPGAATSGRRRSKTRPA